MYQSLALEGKMWGLPSISEKPISNEIPKVVFFIIECGKCFRDHPESLPPKCYKLMLALCIMPQPEN